MLRRHARLSCLAAAAALLVANLVSLVPALAAPGGSSRGRHTNNWAVIVDTSIFWFNYRHIANSLSMYRTVRQLGIPDSQIILMLADDMACHASNPLKAQMFNNRNRQIELYGDNVEVDYRGKEVTVENFMRVLLDRHPPGTPASKRLDTNEGSNIFIFMTGHGGDEFLKFQDSEEISSQDIAGAFEQMRLKGRYNEIFFAVDTCQASTLAKHFASPGVLALGSSVRNENSYSHHADDLLGTSVIDRFTYHVLDFMDAKGSQASIAQLMSHLSRDRLHSTARIEAGHFARKLNEVPLTDFLGSVLQVDMRPVAPVVATAHETDPAPPAGNGREVDPEARAELYPEYSAVF